VNLDDPALDIQSGRMMGDAARGQGKFDEVNYGLGGKLVRELFPGAKFAPRKGTRELLSEGQLAEDAVPTVTPEQADEIVAAVPGAPEKPPEPVLAQPSGDQPGTLSEQDIVPGVVPLKPAGVEDIEAKRRVELERRTWERNINLDYIDQPENIGAVLEANAAYLPVAERESLAAVEAGADYEGLKPYLTGEIAGNLTARQLVAGRNILVGLVEQVNDLAIKVASNAANPEDILKFEKLQAQTIMMQSFMQGQIRETGRALNSMKIVARAINTKQAQVIAGEASQVAESSVIKARRIAEVMQGVKDGSATPAQAIKEMTEMSYLGRSVASIVNYWTASILSGSKTQLVNLISNTTMQAMNTLFVRPLAGVISPLRQAVSNNVSFVGGGPGVNNYEALAELVAARLGTRDALMMAGRVFKEGTFTNKGEYVSSFGDQKIKDVQRDTMPIGQIGFSENVNLGKVPVISHLLNMTQRITEGASYGVLSTGDEFFKAMAYRKSLYAQAVRYAARNSDDPEVILKEASSMLDEGNITKTMHDEAMAEAERLTFTNETMGWVGMMANSVREWTQQIPALRFIAPFISTPAALLDRTIQMSPIAPLQKDFRDRLAKGGADADVALAEMTFGTMMMGMFMMLYHDGSVTGNGPENPAQRKALETTGWQPNSIRVGDKYYSYARGVDPMGNSFAAIANMMDRMAYAQEDPALSDWTIGIVMSLAKHFKDNTYMQGFANALALIDGRKNYTKENAKLLAQFVPSLARDIKAVTGDNEIRVVPTSNSFWKSLVGYTEARVPGMDVGATMPLRYWDGTVVTAGGGEALYLYNSLSPMKVSVARDDLASAYMVHNGIAVTPPDSKLRIGNAFQIDLIDDLDAGTELYDRLLQVVGETRRKAVEAIVKTKEFQKLPGGPNSMQAMALEKALNAGNRAGTQTFLEELKGMKLDPDKYGDAAMLLDDATLNAMLREMRRGDMSETTEEVFRKADLKSLPTREGLPVPKGTGGVPLIMNE